MCGRYTFTQTSLASEVVQPEGMEIEVKARFNIAPTQYCPVIPQDDPDRIHLFRWGLIPHWAKDISIGNRMINARAETVAEKPAFRTSFQHHRCLVLADGFFEWKKTASGKQPFRITLSSEEVFHFAGLSSRWQSPDGRWIYSFTIITTEPNELMKDIHNRMPAILSQEASQRWMTPSAGKDDLLDLLHPYPSEQMKAYAVARDVGNVRNDHPGLILPFQPPPTLFG